MERRIRKRLRSTLSASRPPTMGRTRVGPELGEDDDADERARVREVVGVGAEDDVLHPGADVRGEGAQEDDAERPVPERRPGRAAAGRDRTVAVDDRVLDLLDGDGAIFVVLALGSAVGRGGHRPMVRERVCSPPTSGTRGRADAPDGSSKADAGVTCTVTTDEAPARRVRRREGDPQPPAGGSSVMVGRPRRLRVCPGRGRRVQDTWTRASTKMCAGMTAVGFSCWLGVGPSCWPGCGCCPHVWDRKAGSDGPDAGTDGAIRRTRARCRPGRRWPAAPTRCPRLRQCPPAHRR